MEPNLNDDHKVNMPKLVSSKVKFTTAALIFSVTFMNFPVNGRQLKRKLATYLSETRKCKVKHI